MLSHREKDAGAEGAAPSNPSDPWASRELYIKWKRYSHIHCTWDMRDTLKQLAGYKRVVNYMRKVRRIGRGVLSLLQA